VWRLVFSKTVSCWLNSAAMARDSLLGLAIALACVDTISAEETATAAIHPAFLTSPCKESQP
jgi:hypothetical protein